MTSTTLRRRLRRQAGTSIVEMAIVLPLLFTLTFAIGEFGLMYTNLQQLTNATREGARVGVVFRTPCNQAAVETLITNTINAYAANTGITNPITTNITNACAGTNTQLTVSTSVNHDFIALGALLSWGPNAPLRATSVMRNE